MVNISIIGAGSVAFSMSFIRDLCVTESLWGSKVTLMDISKDRLNMIHNLTVRYMKETKANLKIETTTNRKDALDDAEFVLCTVKVGGYKPMETEREIAERHGYYRGIGDRVCDYYGGFGAYHQLKFFLELARDMEDLCPDAWLIETANPVFEGTTLISRETKIKTIGVCHGHFGYKKMAKTLGLSLKDVNVEVAGFNHCVWMTHFLYKGRDAYPLLDEWIEEKAEKYWKSEEFLKGLPWETEQMSPAAVDMYKQFGLFPIGDTVRSASPWWYHTDLETKKRWFGPTGGFDSEIGWSIYLKYRESRLKRMQSIYSDPSASLTKEFPPVMSGEQHIPIIDSIANDKEKILQLNIPNKNSISGIPDDVVVEIPAVVSGRGVQGIHVGTLPKRLMLYVMIPRMMRMEQILQAFKEGDRKSLILALMEDPRTKSYEQARSLVDELLAQPWNAEAARHYR
ncbi:alpha-glucosidase/alpha-galactosidase [Candidatus Bathyarchaeota archaeon]|nr:alpha-glucosidase/alpha-galactosidase [Candidatus Bathyarchaeota archaeon]RJS87853.1 MAG: alpha-glucosidase/alpha-galactosidase [Candidatus Bathyarchaeota archaeon]